MRSASPWPVRVALLVALIGMAGLLQAADADAPPAKVLVKLSFVEQDTGQRVAVGGLEFRLGVFAPDEEGVEMLEDVTTFAGRENDYQHECPPGRYLLTSPPEEHGAFSAYHDFQVPAAVQQLEVRVPLTQCFVVQGETLARDTKKPLARVEVTCLDRRGPELREVKRWEVISDENGRFELPGVVAGREYSVYAKAEQYTSELSLKVRVHPNEKVTVWLDPMLTMDFHLLRSEQGKLLPWPYTGRLSIDGALYAVKEGRGRLRGLTPGKHYVSWSPHREGVMPMGYGGVELKVGMDRLDIVFAKPEKRAVRAVDAESGKPLVEANVLFVTPDRRFADGARTDDQGMARPLLLPGEYWVRVRDATHPAFATTVTLGTQPVELRCPGGLALTGRVIGPDGRGLAGVEILVYQESNLRHAESKGDGRFLVEGLAVGPGIATATHPQLAAAVTKVHLPATAPVDMRLAAGCPVTVRGQGRGEASGGERFLVIGQLGVPVADFHVREFGQVVQFPLVPGHYTLLSGSFHWEDADLLESAVEGFDRATLVLRFEVAAPTALDVPLYPHGRQGEDVKRVNWIAEYQDSLRGAATNQRIPDAYPNVPAGLWVTEVGVIPEGADCPSWVEIWNHTDQPRDLGGCTLRTLQQDVFLFPAAAVVPPEALCLVLFYGGQVPNAKWEKQLPDGLLVYRVLGLMAFPPFFGDDEWFGRGGGRPRDGVLTDEYRMWLCGEWNTSRYLNELVLLDRAGAMLGYVWWGNVWEQLERKGRLTAYGTQAKNAGLAQFGDSISQFPWADPPGAAAHLYRRGDYRPLALGTATPGRPLAAAPSTPVLTEPQFFGDCVLRWPISREKYNLDFELAWGWGEPSLRLAYDPEMKHPVLRKVDEYFSWAPRCFYVPLAGKDWNRLVGRVLHCRAGKRHIDGRETWSPTVELVLPQVTAPTRDDLESRLEPINDPPGPRAH